MIACTILTAIAAIARTATHAGSFPVTGTIRAVPLRLQKARARGPSRSGAAAPFGAAIRMTTNCSSSGLPSLFTLDRQAARPKLDVHTFGLMVIAIDLIAQHRDSHRKRADDKIKHVGAGHGRIALDAFTLALIAES